MNCEDCKSVDFILHLDTIICSNCGAVIPYYDSIEYTKQCLYSTSSSSEDTNRFVYGLLNINNSIIDNLIHKIYYESKAITKKKKKYVILYLLFSYCIYYKHIDQLPRFISEWNEYQFKKTKSIMRKYDILGYFTYITYLLPSNIIECWYYIVFFGNKLNVDTKNIILDDNLFESHFAKTISIITLIKCCKVDIKNVSKYLSTITINKLLNK